MFNGCTKLEFLDLSSFDTQSIISMEGMFRGCSSLKYLDIRSFIINNKTNIKYIFLDITGNLTLCCENEFSSILSKEYTFINNCSDICF
jgi:surface protein